MHARVVGNEFAMSRVYADGEPEVITTSSPATCNRRGSHTRHGESSLFNVILLSHTCTRSLSVKFSCARARGKGID